MPETRSAAPSLAALLLAVLMPALALAAPGPDPRAEAEREVRGLVAAVNAAYAANDLPRYWTYYAPDFTQWLPEGRTDLASYQKDWTRYIGEGNRIEAAEVEDLVVQVGPSADAAVASYRLRVRTRPVKGEVTSEVYQETDVWFRRGGRWAIVHLHYAPPAAAAPQP